MDINGLFDNLVSVKLIFHDVPLTESEQFDALKRIFESACINPADDTLDGVIGGIALDFVHRNGAKYRVAVNSRLMVLGTRAFYVKRDICQDVRNLF